MDSAKTANIPLEPVMVGASDADGVRELTPWLVQVIGGSAAHLQGTSQLRFSPTQSAIRAASKKCLQLINTRRTQGGCFVGTEGFNNGTGGLFH